MIRLKSLLLEQTSKKSELPNILFIGDSNIDNKGSFARLLLDKKIVNGRALTRSKTMSSLNFLRFAQKHITKKYQSVVISFGNIGLKETADDVIKNFENVIDDAIQTKIPVYVIYTDHNNLIDRIENETKKDNIKQIDDWVSSLQEVDVISTDIRRINTPSENVRISKQLINNISNTSDIDVDTAIKQLDTADNDTDVNVNSKKDTQSKKDKSNNSSTTDISDDDSEELNKSNKKSVSKTTSNDTADTTNNVRTKFTAPTKSKSAFINKWKQIAIDQMNTYGIPASITLAQAAIESGWGTSRLAVQGNNMFGIKCHNWSGDTMRANDDRPNECFRVYDDQAGSFVDHSLFLKQNKRYSSLFELPITDYKGWANGLQSAGYATSRSYASTIISTIEANNFDKFDTVATADAETKTTAPDTDDNTQSADTAGTSIFTQIGNIFK